MKQQAAPPTFLDVALVRLSSHVRGEAVCLTALASHNYFFDPAGLCTDEATFKDFRAKEIKHGRPFVPGVCFSAWLVISIFILFDVDLPTEPREQFSWQYFVCSRVQVGDDGCPWHADAELGAVAWL